MGTPEKLKKRKKISRRIIVSLLPTVKMPAKDDIGLATCKRLLSNGAIMKDVRTAASAAEEAQKALTSFLHTYGAKASAFLKEKKTKTVTLGTLEYLFAGNCYGVSTADLSSAPRKGKGQRGIPLARVERIFREKLAGDSRITEDAKKALVGASEAYLKNLGKTSSLMAQAAKRRTIQAADVLAARQIL